MDNFCRVTLVQYFLKITYTRVNIIYALINVQNIGLSCLRQRSTNHKFNITIMPRYWSNDIVYKFIFQASNNYYYCITSCQLGEGRTRAREGILCFTSISGRTILPSPLFPSQAKSASSPQSPKAAALKKLPVSKGKAFLPSLSFGIAFWAL